MIIRSQSKELLTPRWYPLRYHRGQHEMYHCDARFVVGACGRRSGKTEDAKRKIVPAALAFTKESGNFICAAPTRDQAKEIYWEDLKELSPSRFVTNISESELHIEYVNGARLRVVGMDKPHRVEGKAIDGIILDEYGDMKPHAWTRSVRPALSTIGRPGWAWFIGKPKGRNHFYELYKRGLSTPGWKSFTWKSSTILDPEEIAAAKRELDERTYAQEYDAEFVDFGGRIYYPFRADTHGDPGIRYNPSLPLVFCFDFNIAPGVAAIAQEQEYKGTLADVDREKFVTALVGEVHIPENSNTERVCRKLVKDWGPEGLNHQGDIYLYGDATGGARGTAKLMGSDWDIIKAALRPVFKDRIKPRVADKNPMERPRINAVNARLRTADDKIHMVVNPVKCPKIVEDLEGVTALEGGSGEIDKDSAPTLTHLSDAIGYYIEKKFPLGGHTATSETI